MKNSTDVQTILIVDDTPENIDVLDGLLRTDYRVKVAVNGKRALRIADSSDPPDIILLDVMMPEMDGYEVCRKLKQNENTKEIPVIFITARREMEDEKLGLELGAVDYITKPFSPPIVKIRIKNHLELKTARENLKKQNEILKENVKLREDVDQITRHDLKNPLLTIINAPAMMQKSGPLNPVQTRLCQMLQSSAYTMLDLVNNSLNLLKMEKGMYEVENEQVDLVKIIEHIMWELNELISSKEISVNVMIDDNPMNGTKSFNVRGEEILFRSMLINLLKNALEASPSGETVIVDIGNQAAPVISITNTGATPPEIRGKFFDKYITSGKKAGAGLGTYTAKLVATTLGGDIRLDASQNGKTTITVILPDQTHSRADSAIGKADG